MENLQPNDEGRKWVPPVIAQVRDALDARRKLYKPRTSEVKRLQDNHHEVIRRLLIGQKAADIARELDMTLVQINNIKNSPLVKKQLSTLQAVRDTTAIDVSKRIKECAPKAIDLLEQIIEGRDAGAAAPISLRARVAMDNLDRSGHPRQTNIRSENLHAILTVEDIDDVKRRAVERRSLIPTAEE